jgi:hypothetical protein
MTTTPATETEQADNGDDAATAETSEQSNDTSEQTEKGDAAEEDGSTVTPRERELRKLLRDNERELKVLREAEEARKREEMTELDRLKADLDQRDEELSKLKRTTLLARIAAEHGLDAELTERLKGDTEEELVEDAKRLAELVGKRKPSAAPAIDAGIGVKGDGGAPLDPVEGFRRAMGRK